MKKSKKAFQLTPPAQGKDEDGWLFFDYSNLTQSQTAKIYKDLSHRLMRMHSAGANHILRKDNNKVFEIAFFLREVAERIKKNYPDSDY